MADVKFEEIITKADIESKVKFNLYHEIIEYLLYFLKVFVMVALGFIIIKTSVFTNFTVSGNSMFPTYKDQEIVYVNKLTPNFSDYVRGDVVVIDRPSEDCDGQENCFFLKRIIGVPGDAVTLEDGFVYITDKLNPEGFRLEEEVYLNDETKTFKDRFNTLGIEDVEEGTLGDDEYYVLGDNRGASKDSRTFGFIDKKDIEGKVFYLGGSGFIDLPSYR